MAQGKNKVKAKLPDNVKHKTFNKTKKTAFHKRKSEINFISQHKIYIKFKIN